jgi:hypothetical protein
MGGSFKELGELLDEFIDLPVPIGDRKDGKTKTYRVESPSGRDGLKIEQITQIAVTLVQGGEDINTEMLDDSEEKDTFRLLLGPVYDEMLADGVKWVWLRHAALTCLMWVNSGLQTAEQYWASAGDPERLARNRAERRSKQQGSSAAAKSTRGRASMNGTNHGQGTGHRQHQGSRKSRGANSSKSGR